MISINKLFEEEKPKINYQIFSDQDGVLADFEGRFEHFTGMPGGKELWDYIKPYKPTLLTAPSYHESSRIGKTLWVQDHIPGTPIVFKQAKQKSDLAGPNKILIDDREDTIMNWKSKNGIGILYKNTDQAINELKKLGI
jgi:hypothetical protein